MRRAIVVAAVAALGAGAGLARVAHAQPRSVDAGDVHSGRLEAQAPTIELYTFGVGAVIFEKFGHSALCIRYHDERAHPAICFNYGVTDFGAGSKLIWGFLRSQQKFWVEPVYEWELVRFYKHEDRTIWKQTLPLDEAQARALEDKLWDDTREENRYYYYDHFFDNCTTRLRDMIDKVKGGVLAQGADVDYPLTFREMGRRGMSEFPPIIGLSDFIVGRTLDRKPTLWEAMFLPDILRDEIERKMGAHPVVIYQRRGPPFPTDGPTDRGWILLIALGFYLPLGLAIWRGRLVRAALVWATVPLVLMGLLCWTLSIISSIPMLRWNEALFLFLPIDVLLPIWKGERRRKYAQIRAGMVVWASVFCAVGIFKQPLWVPIVVAFVPHALVAWIEPMLAQNRALKAPALPTKAVDEKPAAKTATAKTLAV